MANDEPTQQPTTDDARREATRAARKRIDRVNDWLYIGGALPAEEYTRLGDAGITYVVDLREDAEDDTDPERLAALGIGRHRAPIPNFTCPTTDQLLDVARWVDGKDADDKVYVHCIGGIGRAAAVTAGLLVLSGLSVEDAAREVHRARPETQIKPDTLDWLRSVEEQRSGNEVNEALD